MSGRGSPPGGLQGPPTLPRDCFFGRGGIRGLSQLSLRLQPPFPTLCIPWEVNHPERHPGRNNNIWLPGPSGEHELKRTMKSSSIASCAYRDSCIRQNRAFARAATRK